MAEADEVFPKGKRIRTPKPPPQPSTPDPIEIAMAAAASGKPFPEVARRVLEEQARFLSAQCAELRLRRIGEGVRAALWAILAVAALAVVGLIIAIVVQASRTDALIVQSFRVPPSLAARGLTGEVVATQVLDKLADMQGRTESVRAASTYANNWEDELKIDIPNTGATTSEVWKVLRGWLGKETRISGEVIETATGLALTTRVGGMPGRRFESPTGDLDKLVADGAELIYRQTQPYRFAIYAGRSGREAERYPILKQLSADPSPIEQKWAYNGLSFDLASRGAFSNSVAMANRALRIDPDMSPAMANGAFAHGRLGHEQTMLDMIRRSIETQLGNPEYDPRIAASNVCGRMITVSTAARDPVTSDRSVECFDGLAGEHENDVRAAKANAALLRHDPVPVMAFRFEAANGYSLAEAARLTAEVHLLGEIEYGASPRLAAALDQFRKLAVLPPADFRSNFYRLSAPMNDRPLETEALLLLGRGREAATLIAATPLDCYLCVRMRGRVAQVLGDGNGADRWFAAAVRLGPRLAPAYADWGSSLAQRRRFGDSEAHLKKAIELAPNWTDPLKYWGDMLAAQGKRAEALRKYDAAVRLAPKWFELRRARQRMASAGS
jgi:tetratricopeptide (TPR) repeat protein